jgi:hypothetical protein
MLISRQLSRDGGAIQARFIEFELFKLWQYMIQSKHEF